MAVLDKDPVKERLFWDRRIRRSLTAIAFFTILLYLVIFLGTFSSALGSEPTVPVTKDDLYALVQSLHQDHGGNTVSVWVISFGGLVIAGLLGAIKVLWSAIRKRDILLDESHAATLAEAKSTARVRGEMLDRVESIHRDSLRNASQDREVLLKLIRTIESMDRKCPLAQKEPLIADTEVESVGSGD